LTALPQQSLYEGTGALQRWINNAIVVFALEYHLVDAVEQIPNAACFDTVQFEPGVDISAACYEAGYK
jgi:hypothetical protein